MIVKIQLDAAGRSLLIYNEDRSLTYQTHNLDQVMAVTEEYGILPLKKAYVEADIDADGMLKLGAAVEPQDW